MCVLLALQMMAKRQALDDANGAAVPSDVPNGREKAARDSDEDSDGDDSDGGGGKREKDTERRRNKALEGSSKTAAVRPSRQVGGFVARVQAVAFAVPDAWKRCLF